MGNSYTVFSVIVLNLLILSIFSTSSSARESFNQTHSIRDGETLVSKSGIFVLGFFNRRSSNNRYLGIWYNFSIDTVVWVANRQNPIKDSSGVLKISSSGNLIIMQDHTGISNNSTSIVVWSSNSTTPKGSNSIINPVAKLLDSGNLVVINEPDGVLIWRSFDYPVDILLQGMKMGIDLKSGYNWYLTSWKSEDDPSIGAFSNKMNSSEVKEFYLTNGDKKIHRSGLWNGHYMNGFLRMIPNSKDIRYIYIDNQTEVSYGFEIIPEGMFSHLKLYSNGTMGRNVWTSDALRWTSYEKSQRDECDNYNRCGPNGVCDIQGLELCECYKGFRPKLNHSWTNREFTEGCVRNEKLNCSKEVGFFRIIGVKLPDTLDATVDKSMSLEDCRVECLSNCSCMAYAALYLSDSNPRGCVMWFGDLLDTKLLANGRQDMFLRLPHSELPNSRSGKNNKVIFIVVGVLVGLLLTVFCWILISWRKKKLRAIQRGHTINKYKENSSKYWKDELLVFDFATIASMTCNFSGENVIGQGGFGIVYKGRMADGQDIAAKRLLKNKSGQGVDEFMNEVTLIAKLQHRNLVRLLGCCMEGDERILVYEFMQNKSLDSIIFGESNKLDWRKRVEIIIGIAKGVLYLHQDSRFRIIHRDLKASNVLLDEVMNPKISDFGTARIFGADQIEENTKRVIGTYGYMSPEYAMDGIFSIKSDVFSFGVLLLEIISGKKNRVFYQEEHELNLLAMAWKLRKDGRSLEFVDETMGSSCPTSEVLRCIQIGLLCVQNRAIDRPSMSDVVFMLSSDSSPLSKPKKPGFSKRRTTIPKYMSGHSSSSRQVSCTINEVTHTDVEGR